MDNRTREQVIANEDRLIEEIKELKNIIKEVREYLPKLRVSSSYELDDKIDDLLEILDKENKE